MLKIRNSSRGSVAVAFCFHKEQVQSLYFAQVAAACVLACPDQQDSIGAKDAASEHVQSMFNQTMLNLLLLDLFTNVQVTLASDLLWHINGREATAAVGYDVTLRQARLQGKIDSTGRACALLLSLPSAIDAVHSAVTSCPCYKLYWLHQGRAGSKGQQNQ